MTRLAAPLAWALAGGAACAAVIGLEPSLLEEGVIVHVAQRLAHGEHLYQDVLVFTGPLPFELLALLFRLFGEELAVGRWALVLLHGLATGAIFSVARSSGVGPRAHVAAAVWAAAPPVFFPLYSQFFYTTLAVEITALSCWTALRGLRSWAWAFLTGMGVAAVGLCKQTTGALLAPALLVPFVALLPAEVRLRRSLAYAGGGALVALATLAGFAHSGGLEALLRGLVTLPLSFEQAYRSGYMNFWPPGQLSETVRANQVFYLPYFHFLAHGFFKDPSTNLVLLTQLLYALPFLALAGVAAIRWAPLGRLRRPLPAATWILAAALLGWISNIFPRTDWGHLDHVVPLAAVTLLCLPVLRGSSQLVARFAAASLVLLATTGAVLSARLLWDASGQATLLPRVPQRPLSLNLRDLSVAWVVRYLRSHTKPGEAIFVPRAEPLLYFATDTRNPTPYTGVLPGIREEQERTILKALEKVRYVVMSDVDSHFMTYYRDRLPRVEAYLERHFRIPPAYAYGRPGWLVLLERGPDRGEAIYDLWQMRKSARPFLRDAQGRTAPAPRFTDLLPTRLNRRLLAFWLGTRGGGLDFDLDLPEGALFQADLGLATAAGEQEIYAHPNQSVARLQVGQNGVFQTLAAIPIVPSDTGWRPIEVSLERFAGQHVTLRLETDAQVFNLEGRVAWWGSPRVTTAATKPATPAS